MLWIYVALAVVWFFNFGCTASSISPNTDLQIRHDPRSSSFDSSYALRREIYSAAVAKRDIQFQNSTSLDTSWDGVTLFKYSPTDDTSKHGNVSLSASVTVICTTCYIKGNITAQLTTDGDFNISQAIGNVTTEVKSDFENTANSTLQFLKNNFTIGTLISDIEHLEFPPIPVDFDIAIPDIPEVTLQLQFDGMELYMQIETVLSAGATYSLNLYTSNIPFVGVDFDKDGIEGSVGLVFTVDLILSVDASISISSGFHIMLDDGLAIDISMLGQNVSHLTFNGGKFEFLPVSIVSSGVVLSAVLRVGAKLGFDVSVDEDFLDDIPGLHISGGIEGGVYADIAQFVTNVTAGSGASCDLEVTEEYTLLLGANAGATIAIDSHTWGPQPSAQTAIFFTTLSSICAISGSATIPSSDALATTTSKDGLFRKADASLTTTTLKTTVTNTATLCLQAGLVNCPASLQSTPQNTATLTTVLTVSSGVSPTFPPITQNAVPTTIPFGTNFKNIVSTSGTPASFIPTATGGFHYTVTSEIKDHKKLVIGLAVGVGVPLLLSIIACCFYCCKRKRSKPAAINNYIVQNSAPYTPSLEKKSPTVTTGTPSSLTRSPASRDNYFQS